MRVLDLSQPEEPSPSLPHPHSFQQPASPLFDEWREPECSRGIPVPLLSPPASTLFPSRRRCGSWEDPRGGEWEPQGRAGGAGWDRGKKTSLAYLLLWKRFHGQWLGILRPALCQLNETLNTQLLPLGNDHALRYFEILKQKELWELHFVWICRVTTEPYLTTLLMLAHFPVLECT